MSEYNFSFDWARVTTLGKVKILVEQVSGAPSQASVNEAVRQYIEDHPGSLTPISEDIKTALLQIAGKVWYVDENGPTYYDALSDALYAQELSSITAVYTQSGTVYDTDSLDVLEDDLVVTAYYTDGTSGTVTGYTLSGSLTVGTSTITVTYLDKTATFDVVVTSGQTLIYTIPGSDLEFKSLGFSAPNYGSNSTTRISYMPFDILVEQGKKYRIIAETEISTADMSVHQYNTTAYDNAQNGQNISNTNVSYTWKGTTDWTFTAGTVNSKAVKCLRFSFRPSTSDPTVSEIFIDAIKIYEVHTA